MRLDMMGPPVMVSRCLLVELISFSPSLIGPTLSSKAKLSPTDPGRTKVRSPHSKAFGGFPGLCAPTQLMIALNSVVNERTREQSPFRKKSPHQRDRLPRIVPRSKRCINLHNNFAKSQTVSKTQIRRRGNIRKDHT